jgi:hypothetical protein
MKKLNEILVFSYMVGAIGSIVAACLVLAIF